MNPNFWYIKDYDINSKDGFKKFVYQNICQCFEQCIDLKDPKLTIKKNQEICSEITNEHSKGRDEIDFYDNLIENALYFFTNNEILIKSGVKYYINTSIKLKLTWENIKSIEDLEIKQLLWLFRKLVVDTILRKLLYKYISDPNFKIYSVGSSSITSDYDITLYGNTDDKIKIIKQFQIEFKKIFREDSSIVFDTNIYGKAYITFNPEEYHEYIECNNISFYYLKDENNSSNDSQLMWGLIKYLSNIRDGLGESIYNDLNAFMIKKTNLPHLKNAQKSLIYLRNKDPELVNYETLFSIEKDFINKYDDKLLGISDYISLINYYGTETYFTRGAFFDIVVNSQMCKQDIIKLNDTDYICSILENAGFFFLHNNKTKYFIRVNKTLSKLISNYKDYQSITTLKEYIQFIELVKKLGNNPDIEYCQWVNKEDDFNLLNCEKYTVFNQLFKIIYKVLYIYSTIHIHNTQINIPFYNNFVIKDTFELGTPVDITPTEFIF